MSRKIGVALGVIAGLALVLWSAQTVFVPDRGTGVRRLYVYGFSILAEPLRERIFPAFAARWRAATGERVEFVDSYAASGTVANQVVTGAPAQVAIFSHPGDADRTVASGASARDWRDQPHGGIVNRSVVVIGCRPGNPCRVRSFACLAATGRKVVHPDPDTSGGAQWAVIAEYGAPLIEARREGRPPDPVTAERQLVALWRNVVAQAPSARAAKTQFDLGYGDVIVTYEVEELLEERKGNPVAFVVPSTTLATEHPIVRVDRNIRPADTPLVDAFMAYLFTDEAQRAFVEYGYRSVRPELDAANPRLRPVEHLFRVDDLGGWDAARTEIVERVWRRRVLPEVHN